MPVYVDTMEARLGQMVMCHMLADTIEELHTMADKIGLKREWFQSRSRFPHYDLCKSKRLHALRLGAIEINKDELVELLHKQENGCRPGELNS